MEHDLTRRQALTLAAACACACCAAGADEAPAAESKPLPKSLTLGKIGDYPKEGFYDKFVKQKVMVSRLEDRLVVMSALCTHKGCVLKVQEPTQLRCPCHHSLFSEQGTPLEGKAKVPLLRYALSTAADGTITADLTRSFEERNWDDPVAFIAVKKPAGGA